MLFEQLNILVVPLYFYDRSEQLFLYLEFIYTTGVWNAYKIEDVVTSSWFINHLNQKKFIKSINETYE